MQITIGHGDDAKLSGFFEGRKPDHCRLMCRPGVGCASVAKIAALDPTQRHSHGINVADDFPMFAVPLEQKVVQGSVIARTRQPA